ncbi:hypothetical protein [Streptomyces sp. H39-C1]|uniref:hypothetical protein n=1 Tax=Streptomyces sp. H39-C1 TaxID=3004355 RepID=UPI0022AE6414|nr:hypothetical protein [Streptomyces sp. H39-C1]MCZ4099380.1 hypothetical protein [Streptomyces sp. H39-C1]
MDLTSTVSALPGATPVEGLPDAWHWSRAVFNFDAVLTPDKSRSLQMNVMGRYDAGLARAVLEFAREHSAEFAAGDRPLVAVGGFSYPGWEFDTIVAVGPAVHDYHSQALPELHQATLAVFPGYRNEFSGTETEDEAWERFRKMLQPTKLEREQVPFLKLSYTNTRTQGGSKGPDRVLAPLSRLLRELPLLEDAPGSHVEWENAAGEVSRAEWDTALTLSGASGKREITIDELLKYAEQNVTGAGSGS